LDTLGVFRRRTHERQAEGETSMDLAEALWSARANGDVIAIEPGQKPASTAAAYQAQAAVAARSGMAQVGWKIGAAAQFAIDMLALDAPFLAPLLAPHCLPDDAEVALVANQSPGLETEFLVALGADLPARSQPYQRDEVVAAVDYVAPAFEVVASRFEGGLKGNGLLVIADGGGNAAIVQGAPVRDWQRFDLASHSVRLSINGAETASGTGSALIFGDPIAAVAWLASQPEVAPRGVRRGDLVMTGTCTGLTPLKAGDRASADFGELGQVHARFT
jgi:2-keto-4-pentenoate hydratase